MKHKIALVAIIMLIIIPALISIACSSTPKTMEVDGTLISCNYFKTVQGMSWAYRIYKISLDDGTSFNILSDPEKENRVDPLNLSIGTQYHLTLLSAEDWTDTWWITEVN
jgi:hypothetical protein